MLSLRRNGKGNSEQGNCKEKVHPQFRGQTALAELLGLPENVKPHSVVGVGYPAEDVLAPGGNSPRGYFRPARTDANLEVVDRFDATRIHYIHY